MADHLGTDDKTVAAWCAEKAQDCGNSAPDSRQHFDVWNFPAGDDGSAGHFGRMPAAGRYKWAMSYEPIDKVPSNLVWSTPLRNQGQTVEVAYSTGVPSGRGVNHEADEGDLYQRIVDRADGKVWFSKRR